MRVEDDKLGHRGVGKVGTEVGLHEVGDEDAAEDKDAAVAIPGIGVCVKTVSPLNIEIYLDTNIL